MSRYFKNNFILFIFLFILSNHVFAQNQYGDNINDFKFLTNGIKKERSKVNSGNLIIKEISNTDGISTYKNQISFGFSNDNKISIKTNESFFKKVDKTSAFEKKYVTSSYYINNTYVIADDVENPAFQFIDVYLNQKPSHFEQLKGKYFDHRLLGICSLDKLKNGLVLENLWANFNLEENDLKTIEKKDSGKWVCTFETSDKKVNAKPKLKMVLTIDTVNGFSPESNFIYVNDKDGEWILQEIQSMSWEYKDFGHIPKWYHSSNKITKKTTFNEFIWGRLNQGVPDIWFTIDSIDANKKFGIREINKGNIFVVRLPFELRP